jgi:hypothetical protein
MKAIMSWCPGQGCDPCKPKPPPVPGGGSGLPPFTDAAVRINQIQVATDLAGNVINYALGQMLIYSVIDNLAPQGGFGTPMTFGPPAQSSVQSSFVLYSSSIQILHPYYPSGSYNSALPDITTGPFSSVNSTNQAASTAAGNAAIAQANTILGNP